MRNISSTSSGCTSVGMRVEQTLSGSPSLQVEPGPTEMRRVDADDARELVVEDARENALLLLTGRRKSLRLIKRDVGRDDRRQSAIEAMVDQLKELFL
ncbi:MAG TPA: hypothetical protein VGE94_15245, partial [Chloroflexota bacterium]